MGSILLSVAILCSCAVQQSLSDTASYSSFTTYPFLESLASDVASWAAFEDRDSFFEKNLIYFAENLEENYGVLGVELRKNSGGSNKVYNVYFTFESLEALADRILSNAQSSGYNRDRHLITFTETDESKRAEIELSLDTWEELSTLIPLIKEPNLEVYGPVYNNPPYGMKSEEEYLYMIDFIFGEGSEDIKRSFINVSFVAPGKVLDTNGRILTAEEKSAVTDLVTDADIVEFHVPLIDVLLLHEPIRFHIEYSK